jgi:phosphatidylglycerol:prolipoprotein diacylglycerol transferase
MPHPPDPVAFTIPILNHPVYWYGLMVTIGTLAAAFVADREARRRGKNPDHVWNALIVIMIFGLLGARLYHVISSPAGSESNLQSYLEDPIKIVNFWSGGGLRGLGIYGAIAGGALGLWVYTKFAKLRFSEWADICVLGLPLGQAIGRWGNYFNQELYGGPTNLPWAMPIDTINRLPQHAALAAEARFHPTFLYESLLDLLVFFVLMYLAHNWEEHLLAGDIALTYLILYPLARTLVEWQRPDAWTVGGIATAQLISLVLMIGAGALILYRHGLRGPSPGSAGDAAAA